jgi:hypothetical protein
MPRYVNAPNLTNYVNAPSPLRRLRYFLDYNGTNSYAELETAFVPAGDFEIELDVYIQEMKNYNPLVSWAGSANRNEAWVYSDGRIGARFGDTATSAISPVSSIQINKLTNVKFKVTGDTLKIYVSGVEVVSVTDSDISTGTTAIDYIGGDPNGNGYFNGVLANPRLTDLDTPANSLNFRLDRPTGNYELPVNNVTGSEEVTNNIFDSATGWDSPRSASTISVVSDKLRSTASGTSTFGSIATLTGMEVGGVYSFSGSATSNNSSVIIRLRVGDESALSNVVIEESAAGSVSIDAFFTATHTTMYIGTIVTGQSTSDYVDIDAGISVKQVTNALVYNNIAEADRFQAQLVGFDWVGTTERVVNGDFSDGLTSWSVSSGDGVISVVDGVANVEKNTTSYPNIGQTIAVTSGSVLLATADFTNPTGSEVYFGYSGGGSYDRTTSTSGSFSLIVTPPSATPRIETGFWSSSGTSGSVMTVDNVTAKRFLEAP